MNDCIDYEAELYYLNLLEKQSHVVSSDLLELTPPEVDEFAFAKKQEISKLKIEPIFFQDKADSLLIYLLHLHYKSCTHHKDMTFK